MAGLAAVNFELSSPDQLHLSTYQQVAWGGATVTLSQARCKQLEEERAEFLTFIDHNSDVAMYGVNIGTGDASKTRLNDAETKEKSTGARTAHSFGRSLPEPLVRGIVLARTAGFLSAGTTAGSAVACAVANMLSDIPLPAVPAQGTAGSGEILPLGHLFSALPPSLHLGVKEPMALVNGAPCAAAMACDAASRAAELLTDLEQIYALACLALNAPSQHFAPELTQAWGGGFVEEVLHRLNALFDGRSYGDQDGGAGQAQARVSVRVAPRMLATAYDAVDRLATVAVSALRHPGDNPFFVPEQNDRPAAYLSNGSFHNPDVVVAIDTVTRVLADLCQLAQHLIHGVFLDILISDPHLGAGSWFMVSADWAEDARRAATPSLLSFAAVGQNDVPNPLFLAWRNLDAVTHATNAVIAVLSMCASQALHLRDRMATPGLSDLVTRVRSVSPPVSNRTDLAVRLDALTEQLEAGQLRRLEGAQQ